MIYAAGTFSSPTAARDAVATLVDAHVEPERIRVASPRTPAGDGVPLRSRPLGVEGAVIGAVLGLAAVGPIAVLTAIEALAFPLMPQAAVATQLVAWLVMLPVLGAVVGSIAGFGRRRIALPSTPDRDVSVRVVVAEERAPMVKEVLRASGAHTTRLAPAVATA